MLTRKQKWKRCMILNYKFKDNNCIPKNPKKTLYFAPKVEETEEQYNLNCCNFHDSKRVDFKQTVKVVLIPERIEYEQTNLSGSLWYSDLEYIEFRRSYSRELDKKYKTI